MRIVSSTSSDEIRLERVWRSPRTQDRIGAHLTMYGRTSCPQVCPLPIRCSSTGTQTCRSSPRPNESSAKRRAESSRDSLLAANPGELHARGSACAGLTRPNTVAWRGRCWYLVLYSVATGTGNSDRRLLVHRPASSCYTGWQHALEVTGKPAVPGPAHWLVEPAPLPVGATACMPVAARAGPHRTPGPISSLSPQCKSGRPHTVGCLWFV
jgi:hypothetical protein